MPYLHVKGSRFHYHLDDYSDPWLPRGTILLHHSAAGNLHRWRAWVPNLARHHRVLRFDMRGHGKTPPPPGGQFSLPGLAGDIAAVMDGLEIEKVHLVGASAGGIVSLRFAHDFPSRLHSLTLVASTPKLAQTGTGIDTGVWRRTLEETGTKAWLLSDARKRFGPSADPGLVEWYAVEGEKTPTEVVLALQGCLLGEDLTSLLPQIPVPALILAASQDEITPLEIQHLMARQMPGATLQTFDGVGHNMKVEIPDFLAGQALQFIEQVDAG
jgi:pimeloyl-ACP methyl ester carboxylesterase